jgi:hypothetical protein
MDFNTDFNQEFNSKTHADVPWHEITNENPSSTSRGSYDTDSGRFPYHLDRTQSQDLETPLFTISGGERENNTLCSTAHIKTRPKRKAQNTVLQDWLLDNRESPYPNKEQLLNLAELSGRSLKQTRNALSNLRARKRPGKCTLLSYMFFY